MATIDELEVLITANSNQFKKEISKTQDSVKKLSNNVKASNGNLTTSFLKAGIFAKTLGIAVKGVVGSLDGAVSRLDTLNNYTNVMSNLGVNSDDAEASIQRLSDKLQGLPTTLDDAASAVQRFTSANGDVKASTEMFLALNNAILAGGANMQVQQSALEQLSQSYSKGKPDMMEWRTAMMAMPAQLKQTAQAMGYVNADALGEALRNGEVSMNEFMATLVRLNKEGTNGFQSFEDQARNSTGGVRTSMINVKTAITRGLTEIMNAIGQSNIAGFFNEIARAINRVVPYITGFVKACVWAVSSVTSLFGGKTNKNVKKTADSLKSIGTNAGGTTSKGLDKATGSAKKLNKELGKLAGFDEMNALSDNSDSGGDDGSSSDTGDVGGGLNDIDLSGFNDEISKSSDGVTAFEQKVRDLFSQIGKGIDFSKVIDSIHNFGDAMTYLVNGGGQLLKGWWNNFFVPMTQYTIGEFLPDFLNATADAIKKIDFGTLEKSFDNLWKALEPFNENVGDGLLFLYKEVLLPISKIVINDILLGFLTLLAGAIDVLNTAIDKVKPVFEWLWKSFLEPIVTWTGGVIGDVLTAIGDALSWIAQNEIAVAILEGLGIAIGIVTIAMNAANIAIGIFNVIGAIASAVTSALAIAFTILTSPITLVVLAIGAVIAVVILLVKHWDEVKETAQKVWDKIVDIWQGVADWFNDNVIEPIKAFFEPIGEFFTNLFTGAWNGVKGAWNGAVNFFSEIWNGISNAFKFVGTFFSNIFRGAWDGIKTIWNSVTGFFKGIWDGIKSVFSNVGGWFRTVFQGAKDVISNVWSGVSSIIKAPINFLIDGLNTFISGVNKIKIPDWVPGVGGKGFKISKIPKLARGTVVDSPTVAMIGEAGKEAVVPLENNTGWIDELASKINNRGAGEAIHLTVNLGDDTIYDKFIDYANEKNFESNGEVFV